MESRQRNSVYKKTDPEELVKLIAQNLNDRNILNPLFSEFHTRYARYIINVIKKDIAINCTFEEGDLVSLSHDTLLRSIDASPRYRPSPTADRKEQDRRVKAWLGGIADNEYKMYVRHAARQFETQHYRQEYCDESIPCQVHETVKQPATDQIKQIHKAFRKLPQQDQDILGTYLKNEDQYGKIEPYLHQSLSQTWNQLPQNLKKIKQRAIEKLKHTLQNPLKAIKHEKKSETRIRSDVRAEAKVGFMLDGPVVPGDTGTG